MWRMNNRLVVPVLIDSKPVPLLFDTGGTVSILSPRTAAELKLQAIPPVAGRRAAPSLYGIGGSRDVSVMRAGFVAVGSLYAHGVPFVVPADNFENSAKHDPNVLGMNFLAGFDMDVDATGRKLVFFRADGACSSPHVMLSQPLYPVREIADGVENRPVVTASIRGERFRALLDTGAPRSLLFRAAAARLGLSLDMHGPDAHDTVSGIGPRSVEVVRHLSEPIEVGGLTISQVRFDVSGEDDPRVDMVLGMDFLSKVRFWISNSSHEVVFQLPSAAPVETPAFGH
jgi:predicted aspartyl protease